MNIRTLCLSILQFGDASGYEIKKLSTESHFSIFVEASYGSIYPALSRLEKDGSVEFREEREAGKPARKIYTITNIGRKELIESLGVYPKPDIIKSEFLLMAICAELLPRSLISRIIDHRLEQLNEEIKTIHQAQEEYQSPGTDWIGDYGITCLSASITYLIDNREKLEALGLKDETSQINSQMQEQI